MGFVEGARFLENVGFLDVVLPFMFVFVVVYAFLERTHVLGMNVQHYNSIVAFVLGFFFISFGQYVIGMNQLLIYVALLIVAFFFVALFTRFLGVETEVLVKSDMYKVALFLFLVLAFVFAFKLDSYIDLDSVAGIIKHPVTILLVVIVGFIVIVTKDTGKVSKKNSQTQPSSTVEHKKPSEPTRPLEKPPVSTPAVQSQPTREEPSDELYPTLKKAGLFGPK